MSAPVAAISVDLDTLHHYGRIHRLGQVEAAAGEDPVYALAVPRFVELFAEAGVEATFFAIGEDLDSKAARRTLKDAAEAGVEIGSHSHAHDYALSRRPFEEIAEDLLRADRAIEAAIGRRPRGFRAPGYTLSPELYRAITERGYLYDSSTFPAMPYWAAKAGVMGAMRVLGRPSGAILDSPRVLLAPTEPYLPDPHAPYRRGPGRVVELPISVAPVSRIPFIGSTVTLLPRRAVSALYRTLRGAPLLNFELHAVDLLSADDGLPPALVRRQPELRIPFPVKRARLLEVFRWIRDDFESVTLAEAAERSRPAPEPVR
jgi:peptidoglycan/xylan/chitin deacetylase (PgdA/CDA1 family)